MNTLDIGYNLDRELRHLRISVNRRLVHVRAKVAGAPGGHHRIVTSDGIRREIGNDQLTDAFDKLMHDRWRDIRTITLSPLDSNRCLVTIELTDGADYPGVENSFYKTMAKIYAQPTNQTWNIISGLGHPATPLSNRWNSRSSSTIERRRLIIRLRPATCGAFSFTEIIFG